MKNKNIIITSLVCYLGASSTGMSAQTFFSGGDPLSGYMVDHRYIPPSPENIGPPVGGFLGSWGDIGCNITLPGFPTPPEAGSGNYPWGEFPSYFPMVPVGDLPSSWGDIGGNIVLPGFPTPPGTGSGDYPWGELPSDFLVVPVGDLSGSWGDIGGSIGTPGFPSLPETPLVPGLPDFDPVFLPVGDELSFNNVPEPSSTLLILSAGSLALLRRNR